MYDPLKDKVTASAQPYPDSFWASYIQPSKQFSPLKSDEQYDVVIIGAGFSGMSCARFLQETSGLSVAILEANQPGWGCSGRNAGFILPGSGRLDYTSLNLNYGDAAARATLDEYYQALDTLQSLIAYANADCDVSNGGYLKIGHSQQAFEKLCQSSERLPEAYKQQYEVVSAQDIASHYIPGYQSFGGVYRSAGQALNPLKLSLALAQTLHDSAVTIYGNSPVLALEKQHAGYRLQTPKGSVTARKVVLASNAYSLKSLLPGLSEKQFPVLSSVLVTSPLPDAIATQWRANLMAMDTRSLKYYFRLLPDNRLLFGGRGAISGAQANTHASQKNLKHAFNRYFPTLKALTVDWFWSGWVSVSADDIPHVMESEQYPGLYYATGYCGSGVAYSCQAGKRLADWLTKPDALPDSPIYQKPIPAFPFSGFRRIGLRLFYAWHRAMEQLTMK